MERLEKKSWSVTSKLISYKQLMLPGTLSQDDLTKSRDAQTLCLLHVALQTKSDTKHIFP